MSPEGSRQAAGEERYCQEASRCKGPEVRVSGSVVDPFHKPQEEQHAWRGVSVKEGGWRGERGRASSPGTL